MNFVVDAQLPRRMAAWLAANGHDAKHTLDMPDANRSSDDQVIAVADLERAFVFIDRNLFQCQLNFTKS